MNNPLICSGSLGLENGIGTVGSSEIFALALEADHPAVDALVVACINLETNRLIL